MMQMIQDFQIRAILIIPGACVNQNGLTVMSDYPRMDAQEHAPGPRVVCSTIDPVGVFRKDLRVEIREQLRRCEIVQVQLWCLDHTRAADYVLMLGHD